MVDQETLIDILSKGPASFRTLARKLNVPVKKNKDFSKFLFTLLDKGEIMITPSRDFYVPIVIDNKEGTIRLNAKGFGFVDFEEYSVFVAPGSTLNSMDGDTVQLDIFKDPSKPDAYQGFVKKVLIRNKTEFVGRVMKFGHNIGIKPFDNKINGKFKISNKELAIVDNEVKVRITRFGNPSTVEIIKVLGNKDDVSMDILVAIEDAGIPEDFSPDVHAEVRSIPSEVSEAETVGREDIRGRMIVTIDGDDTKDFDDAIEIERLENGNFLLGVHIADVTHYVKEGRPLDNDAKQRGTSVYLADRVIPMLPKELSNGICSLNPKVDRLVISCTMEIDRDGNTVSHKIFPSVMHSKYRLTYQDVNKYYRQEHAWDDKNLHKMLDDALELSKILRKYKLKEGYIDFEIEESKIIINDEGKTSDIVPRDRLESEMMIEDFMVRANETVAYHVAKEELNFIYRVHDKPDIDRVTNLNSVVKVLGMDVQIPSNPIPSEFAKSINQIKESRFDDFMKIMMLRTMAKAVYSPENIGHFGLASKYYTHFTSPIRRYPDLMVHRMLREYYFNKNKKLTHHFGEIMGEIADHSSMTEQRAMDLERKVADIKKAEFYEQYVGQSFEGTIVSMMKFGFFVEFPNKVGGLVHISTLVNADYKLTNNGYSLASKTVTYTVGDKIDVTVVGAMKSEGKIDLVATRVYKDWQKREDKMGKYRRR